MKKEKKLSISKKKIFFNFFLASQELFAIIFPLDHSQQAKKTEKGKKTFHLVKKKFFSFFDFGKKTFSKSFFLF